MAGRADVAFSLQGRAVDYEPSCIIPCVDIFFGHPLKIMGISRQEWLDNHLSEWGDFVEEPTFHEADGAHYTTLLPENVDSFQGKLKKVLQLRNV